MAEYWKIKREVVRISWQLRGVVERFTDPVAQQQLDRTVAAGLPTLDGEVPLQSKVALFLVWQPDGLSESTLATCSWLAKAGYAPLLVSNSPLSSFDRDRLTEVAWRAVERPNFGHDFGGYRDGLTCLRQWGVKPDEMLILNDSVWLPVLPETDLLDLLTTHPADVAGTILRQRGEERFLESYLYRLSAAALEHPGFAAYWATLRLTSNKYHVIRRGERGFSASMRAAGLRVEGIFDDLALTGQIAAQDDNFLRLTLRYAAHIDSHMAAESARLAVDSGPDWHSAALEHIQNTLRKRMGYSTFPYAMMRLNAYPLLKKSRDPVGRAWRRAYLNAVLSGDLPAPPENLLAEIRGRDAGR